MKRILIVDDEENWREYHKKMVLELIPDCEICCAENAENGYASYLGKDFDVLITDMQMECNYMPKLAGEWLIEQIQNTKKSYKTKIVIISGSPKIKYIAEKYNVDFLPKNVAVSFPQAYEIVK